MLKDDHLTNIAAFHCEQCVEKCFKAVIEENSQDIPRIHNLIRLYDIIKSKIKTKINEDHLKMLNETYIDTRYPSDLGLLPEGKPSKEKVRKFYKFSDTVYKTILKYLESK
ncbi:MAG: HEPN domain-containing protein [Elusimicrobia bacterium]|nr:HEPN domain-containing protein [Candidatus Liberimonas magnetica]